MSKKNVQGQGQYISDLIKLAIYSGTLHNIVVHVLLYPKKIRADKGLLSIK